LKPKCENRKPAARPDWDRCSNDLKVVHVEFTQCLSKRFSSSEFGFCGFGGVFDICYAGEQLHQVRTKVAKRSKDFVSRWTIQCSNDFLKLHFCNLLILSIAGRTPLIWAVCKVVADPIESQSLA
jgi:hypothetical protein